MPTRSATISSPAKRSLSCLAKRSLIGALLACGLSTCGAATDGLPATPDAQHSARPDAPSGETASAAERQPEAEGVSRSPEPAAVVQGSRAATFELKAPEGEPARVLRVEVERVVNPGARALVLVITALLPSRPVEVGRLSFFPAGEGGIFVLRLPPAVAKHVAEKRSATVRCGFEAGVGDERQVRLRAVALMAEPDPPGK